MFGPRASFFKVASDSFLSYQNRFQGCWYFWCDWSHDTISRPVYNFISLDCMFAVRSFLYILHKYNKISSTIIVSDCCMFLLFIWALLYFILYIEVIPANEGICGCPNILIRTTPCPPVDACMQCFQQFWAPRRDKHSQKLAAEAFKPSNFCSNLKITKKCKFGDFSIKYSEMPVTGRQN